MKLNAALRLRVTAKSIPNLGWAEWMARLKNTKMKYMTVNDDYQKNIAYSAEGDIVGEYDLRRSKGWVEE